MARFGPAEAATDFRRGLYDAPLEDIGVAALVSLPFSGTLVILLGAMGLPSVIGVVVAGLVQGVLTFWIAGHRLHGGD